MPRLRLVCLTLLALLMLAQLGCKSAAQRAAEEARARFGGDPVRGAVLIQRIGCGGCHRIPGIPGASGKTAPSLARLSQEPYISGSLANSPENVVRWICDPHSVLPRTKMPEYGLSEGDARDIATYLWSLH
ncbi:MAG: cytochrome c [Acidobacteriota bacterium]|nr:cytochrome c [Acidobacteriota bacterium]